MWPLKWRWDNDSTNQTLQINESDRRRHSFYGDRCLLVARWLPRIQICRLRSRISNAVFKRTLMFSLPSNKRSKKMKQKVVLTTPFVRIVQTEVQYQVFITMSEGGIVEHNPFPNNVQGLVAALQLATEICAGKFFLMKVVKEKGSAPELPEAILLKGEQ